MKSEAKERVYANIVLEEEDFEQMEKMNDFLCDLIHFTEIYGDNIVLEGLQVNRFRDLYETLEDMEFQVSTCLKVLNNAKNVNGWEVKEVFPDKESVE